MSAIESIGLGVSEPHPSGFVKCDHINQLPLEIHHKFFSLLPFHTSFGSCRRVCKQWKSEIEEEAEKRLCIVNESRVVPSWIFEKYIGNNPRLLHLKLHSLPYSDSLLEFDGDLLTRHDQPNLITLDLKGTDPEKVWDIHLMSLFTSSRQLKKVCLSDSHLICHLAVYNLLTLNLEMEKLMLRAVPQESCDQKKMCRYIKKHGQNLLRVKVMVTISGDISIES